MSDVAFGRRVSSLPRIPSAQLAGARAASAPTTKEIRVGSIVFAQAASTVSRQILQRRIEKTEELLALQRERDKAETGVIRVLMATSRQRLMEIRRHRDMLRADNVALVSRITALEGTSMGRIAEQLNKHARFAAAATSLHGRGEMDREQAAFVRASVGSAIHTDLSVLQNEQQTIEDDITTVKGRISVLQAFAHGEEVELVERAQSLREDIETAKIVCAQEQEQLRVQREAALERYASLQEKNAQEFASKVAMMAWDSMAPQLKAMTMETAHMRKEVELQQLVSDELRASIASLETEQRALREQLERLSANSRKPLQVRGLPSRSHIPVEAVRCIDELVSTVPI